MIAGSINFCYNNEKLITAAIPCNLRKALGKEDVFEDAWDFLFQSIGPSDLKSKDEDTYGKELRSHLKELMDPNQLKTMQNKNIKISLDACECKSKEERKKYYLKKCSYVPGTYMFSYIGSVDGKEYMNEIESAIWTSVTTGMPMITMVEIGGEFSISIIQNFEESKYVDALAKAIEDHGINIISKSKLPSGGQSKVMYGLN